MATGRPQAGKREIVNSSESSAAATEDSPPNSSDVSISRGSRSGRRMLLVAVLAAGLWWVILAVLAWTTANPVTLNLAQVRQADYLVTARIDDLDAGTITIEKEWKHAAPLSIGSIENLAETDAIAGQSYLLPLTADGDRMFRITEARLSARRDLNGGLPVPFRAMVVAGRGRVQSAADGTSRDVTPGDRLNAEDRVLSGRFQIIRISPPYVYPATDEAVRQLRELQELTGSSNG